jgi:hypothetical protein
VVGGFAVRDRRKLVALVSIHAKGLKQPRIRVLRGYQTLGDTLAKAFRDEGGFLLKPPVTVISEIELETRRALQQDSVGHRRRGFTKRY